MARWRNEKLAPRYFGPFEILERIGQVAYRLKLPDTARIHAVFHVSQLRKAIGERVASAQLPATLTDDMEVLLQPGQVEGVRQGDAGLEVLIRWADLPDYEATWESGDVIKEQFPHFNLEDKVRVWEGSNDRTHGPGRFGLVYRRKH